MHSDPSTRRRPRPLVRSAILVAALALLAGACGDDDSNGDAGAAADASADTDGAVAPALVEPVDVCEDVPDASPGAVNRGAVVNMIDFEFCQDDVTVEVGEAVEFIANGAVRHQVVHQPDDDTERAFQSSSLNTGDSFLHQFDSPGTFPYICVFHPDQMVGEVTVVEG